MEFVASAAPTSEPCLTLQHHRDRWYDLCSDSFGASMGGHTRQLAAFAVLAYLISWTISLPLLLGQNGLGVFPYIVPSGLSFALIVLQSYGPSLAAILLSTPDQRRDLASRMRHWGGGWESGFVCVVAPPAALVLGSMLVGGRAAVEALSIDISLILTFMINVPVLLVLGGPLGEEAGWRGFILPRLQGSLGPLLASVAIGCIWAFWHLPNFFIPQMGTWQGSIGTYVLLAMLLSLIHTAVYNRSGGSLLAVIVLHASVDASSRTILPAVFGDDRAGATIALLLAFSILLLLVAALGGLKQTDVGPAVTMVRSS